MASRPLGQVLDYLRRTVRPTGDQEPSDGQLLRRFVADRDEDAFAALLHRHGAMVWGVCRRVLTDANDVDDAFQATFLVLVRKAGAIAKHESVSSWLHGVAHRVAVRAKSKARDRRQRESEGAAMARSTDAPGIDQASELRTVLDEELEYLPEKYRAPLVLCYLQGRTNDEAAALLGWTRGTVAGRMARARDLLRGRLARRGLALASAALAPLVEEAAAVAAVPASLTDLTLRTALAFAAGTSSNAAAAALAEGVLNTMWKSKLKTVASAMFALALVGTGLGVMLSHAATGAGPAASTELSSSPAPALVVSKDPVQTKTDRPAVVQGNTAFACDLFARLRQEEGNICFSPYSISSALAMTYAGARGDTATEMAQVLHFTLPPERFHPAAGSVMRDLNDAMQPRKHQLNVANALWGQKGLGFREDFLNLTKEQYGAGLTEVDYVQAAEAARLTINAWVAKQTMDKIKDLLGPSDINPDTRLVLTNTVYFKAAWLHKFKKDNTREGPFQLASGGKITVPLMHETDSFPYLDTPTFQAVELPFVGKDLSMVIFLPKKVDGLAELEKSLTADKLAAWSKEFTPQNVHLTLPRFKIRGKKELAGTLAAMGMPRAFSNADFSGMNDKRDLFISKVIHEAFVDVNEEGTEAGAATAVVMDRGGAPEVTATFTADHPFLFLIRDNRTSTVLFLGHLMHPGK